MMRFLRLLLVVTLLLVSVPQPARAFDAPGCGCGPSTYTVCDEWRSAEPNTMKPCVFTFEGFPITVYGHNEAGGSVHVWVTVRGYPEYVLVECEARPQCGDEIHDEDLTEPLPPFPNAVPRLELTCTIQASGYGVYYCSSGRA